MKRNDAMSCSEVRALIDQYRRGELPIGEAQALEQHIDACQACADMEYDADRIGGLMRQLTAESLPDDSYFRETTAKVLSKIYAPAVEPEAVTAAAAAVIPVPASKDALSRHYFRKRWWFEMAAAVALGIAISMLAYEFLLPPRAAKNIAMSASATPPPTHVSHEESVMRKASVASAASALRHAPQDAELKLALAPPAAASAMPEASNQDADALRVYPAQPMSSPNSSIDNDNNKQTAGYGVAKRRLAPSPASQYYLFDSSSASSGVVFAGRPSMPLAPSTDALRCYLAGEDAAFRGQYEGAIALFERAARLEPAAPLAARAKLRIGEISLRHVHDPVRARAAFQSCLEEPARSQLDENTLRAVQAGIAETSASISAP
ncbi:MAG: anti-sigma factor [bacterium]|nr:anti-sigma factor [Candidatus Sumerlaeota bacterium]